MAYVKQHWKDEVTEYEHRFTETANGDGTITHTKVTGEVLQEGTLQDAEHFNHMEDGIGDAHDSIAAIQAAASESDTRIESLEKIRKIEVGTVTLTNSLAAPFNNTLQSIPLETEQDDVYYLVDILSVSGYGNIGEVQVSDRQVNGFKLSYTGSAPSAEITYMVIGGFVDSTDTEEIGG